MKLQHELNAPHVDSNNHERPRTSHVALEARTNSKLKTVLKPVRVSPKNVDFVNDNQWVESEDPNRNKLASFDFIAIVVRLESMTFGL